MCTLAPKLTAFFLMNGELPSSHCLYAPSEQTWAVLSRQSMVKSDKMQQTSSPGCSLLCLTHLSCFFLNKTCQCRGAEWGLEMMCAELRQGLRGQRGDEDGAGDPAGDLGQEPAVPAAGAPAVVTGPARPAPPVPCRGGGRAPHRAGWCRRVASASRRPWRKSSRSCL